MERGLSTRQSSLKGRERAIVNRTNIGRVSKAMLGRRGGKDEKGPSSIGRTLEGFQRRRWGDGVERMWAFPNAYIPS